MNRYFLFALLLCLPAAACQRSGPATGGSAPAIRWTLTAELDAPESVAYDAASGTLFISNVAGAPTEQDYEGWILTTDLSGKPKRLELQGQPLEPRWLEGLSAPKGLAVHEGWLWLADITQVQAVQLSDGQTRLFEPAGAQFLNDVAIDDSGTVYVSDTFGNRIYRLPADAEQFDVLAEGPQLESPNGLLVQGDELVVAAWGAGDEGGRLYEYNITADAYKFITPEPVGRLDGVAKDRQGNYLVSDWKSGAILRITPGGEVSTIVENLDGPADFLVLPDEDLLIVPQMNADQTDAYSLSVIDEW